MTNVEACKFAGPVTGTPDADDVSDQFGGAWTNKGGVAMADGTSNLLTVDVTSGSWGALPVGGTIAIDGSFWDLFGRGVITFHLGNGAGDPDWFFFELTHDTNIADFSVVRLSGSGGGLSNINLWGTGEPFNECTQRDCQQLVTPEPGSLLLLGTGLTLFAARLRRRMRS